MLKLTSKHIFALALTLLFSAGCASDRFTIGGEQERVEKQRAVDIRNVHDRLRNSRALRAPSLFVDPPEALGRAYQDVEVLEHAWIPRKGRARLVLQTSKKERIQIAYQMNKDRRLPLATGRSYKVRIYHPTTLPNQRFVDEEPIRDDTKRHAFVRTKRQPDFPDVGLGGLQGWALVARTPDNNLQGMLMSGRWRELDPDRNSTTEARGTNGLMLEILERTAYTEVRRATNLCRAVVEHAEVAAIADGRTQELLPGTSTQFTLGESTYELLVLDASRTTESPCGSKQEGHVSFGLVKLP